MAALNPLDKGECYGMTMDQMQHEMPVRTARCLTANDASEG